MNPGWLIAGLQIGQLIAPSVRKHGKPVVRNVYWTIEERVAAPLGMRLSYRRWLRSLSTRSRITTGGNP